MSNFDDAFDWLMRHEGLEYTNDPDDAGGATKFGITQKSLNEMAKFAHKDVKDLKIEEAKEFYENCFWAIGNFSNLQNRMIAIKVFDLSVLCGLRTAIKLFQQAVNRSSPRFYIDEDGRMGPKTIQKANKCVPEILLRNFILLMKNHFSEIVNKNPQNKKFIDGWLNRVNDPVPGEKK